jgi:ech hydrogenase subunit A
VHSSEWLGTGLMVVLCVFCCVGMPLISDFIVQPYLMGVWGSPTSVLSADNLGIASICTIFVVFVLFGAIGRTSKKKQVGVYLAGTSVDNDARKFRNSMSGVSVATSRNWYMESIFGEPAIDPIGTVGCIGIIVLAFVLCLLGVPVAF